MPSAMQRIRDVYRVPAHRGGRVRLDWADYGEGTITRGRSHARQQRLSKAAMRGEGGT